MFHLHFQKPKNPWGACPTRIGASWASFIAAFGQRCCGTITGAASCWMDWPMSPSGTRFEWFGRMMVIWCPKIPLLPWPAMACHGLPWPAMAYDVGFLPPFFFNKHGQTQKKCCFRGKLTGKHSFVAKKLNLCVLFSLKLDETCLKLHHGISMVYLYKSPDASPKAGVPQSTRSQRSCSTSRWKGWRNSSFRLPTAPQTLPHRKSLGGYQETYETYADFQTLTFVEDER